MFHRTKKPLISLACLALLAAGDPFDSGLTAYQEGRFKESLDLFRAAEKAAGRAAPTELVYNRALAALRAGELRESETAAQRAAARGGADFMPLCLFLKGNAAFARCELAAAQAETPGAPPFAYDAAISLARTARTAWQRAAMSRPDWPAARRNVERALLKEEALAKLKKARARGETKKMPAKARPHLVPMDKPGAEKERKKVEEAPSPQKEAARFSPVQVKRLLDFLNRKEKEKIDLRRSRRRARQGGVERDW